MNTVEIFSSPSPRTEQITSRYRPIAPRPQLPPNFNLENPTQPSSIGKLSVAHSQTRPFRSRKTNSTTHPTATNKKSITQFSEIPQLGFSFQGSSHGFSGFSSTNTSFNSENPTRNTSNFITLSLFPYSRNVQALDRSIPVNTDTTICFHQMEGDDSNYKQETPEEKELLQKLQAPSSASPGNVIMPQPMRPIGSSFSVGFISDNPSLNSSVPVYKKSEEVEEEMELESFPAVISDLNNRVRLANSAYMKMVGQPECKWLDSTVNSDGWLRSLTKRINGEVVLDFGDSTMPGSSSNGFSCKMKIGWVNNGDKVFITALCEVIRLSCDSKNYHFAWRFHTSKASDTGRN